MSCGSLTLAVLLWVSIKNRPRNSDEEQIYCRALGGPELPPIAFTAMRVE